MADEIKEVRTKSTDEGGGVVEKKTVNTNNPDKSAIKIQSLIYSLLGLLEGLLAIRFILALLGANTTNTFASFIYNVTQPLVAPFQGLFNYTFQAGVSRLEIETLVAMAIYALAVWFIIKLVELGKKNPEA